MRKLLLMLVLLFVPVYMSGQQGEIAHGAEKDVHKIAHPSEEHGEAKEAPKTYFGIPGWLLKLVNMGLFIGVLYYFLGGPVKKSFAERGDAIRKAAEEAKARRAKADQLAADIQARLTQIEQDVQNIHDRALREGERQKRELIAAAEAEAQKILAQARSEVDNRLKHARHELTEYAGELAAKRAEEIVREKIQPADQKKIFSESLSEVASS
jgi:F-type H+-transporting ATPase subunit b